MMNLKQNGYEKVDEVTVENLVIRDGRKAIKTVALADGALALKRGTLLFLKEGKYGATGDAAAAILAEDVSADAAGDVVATVYLSGTFNANGITGTLDEAVLDALRTRDIFVLLPAV